MVPVALRPSITVRNLQRRVRLDLPWLRRFAAVALEESIAQPAGPRDQIGQLPEVTVAIVSDRRIAEIHVEFMGVAGATDVITFDHGDIVISAETARAYAAEYGQTPDREVALYLLHGLLHLQGFDDQTPVDHRRMHAVQARLFKRCLGRIEMGR